MSVPPEPPPQASTPARVVGFVAAGVLWLAAGLLAGLRGSEGESAGFVVGQATGSLVFSALLALAVRALYVRFGARPGPLWSPWLPAIAFVILFLSLLGRVSGGS